MFYVGATMNIGKMYDHVLNLLDTPRELIFRGVVVKLPHKIVFELIG